MGFKKFYINENTTINEGGAFGHLSNVYDMNNYTFSDLKTIISLNEVRPRLSIPSIDFNSFCCVVLSLKEKLFLADIK